MKLWNFVNLKKKSLFPSFFLLFFQFLTLKHNVKNVNLENVILRERKINFLCTFWSNFLQKKKVIFFVPRAKVEKNKKFGKNCLFINFPVRLGEGGVYYDAPCILKFIDTWNDKRPPKKALWGGGCFFKFFF